jgi:hypothetical protein
MSMAGFVETNELLPMRAFHLYLFENQESTGNPAKRGISPWHPGSPGLLGLHEAAFPE